MINEHERGKVEGETTAVFTVGSKFLTSEATRLEQPLMYRLQTGFPSVCNWANTTGRTIFRWDRLEMDYSGVVADATIQPKTNYT